MFKQMMTGIEEIISVIDMWYELSEEDLESYINKYRVAAEEILLKLNNKECVSTFIN